MKIGKNFTLNGVKWTINKVKGKDHLSPERLGSESIKDALILLFDVDREQTQVENDLCHEVVHAILDGNGIYLGDTVTMDEHFVQVMANGVHQYIKSVLDWQK